MQNGSVGNTWIEVVKGVALALGLSFLGVIIVASLLPATGMEDKVLYPLMQTVKIVAVFVGVVATVRADKGLLKGVVIGVLFTALSYLTFSAVGGDFSLSWLIACELLLCVIAGGIAGAIAVNVKK
jgi:putative membrane protein (TIGR04086 family)